MHKFTAHLTWNGNRGDGTSNYRTYGREYHVAIDGKSDLSGSAAKEFRGDDALHNPEDLFLAAISACHLLTYLALCARNEISVLTYEDRATGTLRLDARGGGKFDEVTLHPSVEIAAGGDLERAIALHKEAHELCFIANSCSVPIGHEPTVRVAS